MKRLILPLLATIVLPTALVASNKGSIKDTCVQYELLMINEKEAMKRLGLPEILYGETIAPDDYSLAIREYCILYKDF